ncbi:MAG: hypothetical protein AAF408_00115 [Pseudomonadota bacterium]
MTLHKMLDGSTDSTRNIFGELEVPSNAKLDLVARLKESDRRYARFVELERAYTISLPTKIEYRDRPKTGMREYFVAEHRALPHDVRTAANGVISELRNVLDNTVYQLALHSNGGAKPNTKIYFPISSNQENYDNWKNKSLKPLPREIIRCVDQIEPYKGGKGHRLWQLNTLSRIDKHHQLIGASARNSGVSINHKLYELVPGLNKMKDKIPRINLNPAYKGPVEVGSVLYSEPISDNDEFVEFDFFVSFMADEFDSSDPAGLVLGEIKYKVWETIDVLMGFL